MMEMDTIAMRKKIADLIPDHHLEQLAPDIEASILPAVQFALVREDPKVSKPSFWKRFLNRNVLQKPNDAQWQNKSHFGGHPDVPAGFIWPEGRGRPLEFMIQINLAEITGEEIQQQLPATGLLSFFFDWKEMPIGYEPGDLDGFRVFYFQDPNQLQSYSLPPTVERFPLCSLRFSACLTLPDPWSMIFDHILSHLNAGDDTRESYMDFLSAYHTEVRSASHFHQLLGHSSNVQNDMQREAQLVTHGFNLSDTRTYEDPRAKALEPGASDWQLLLQLDTDTKADMMWGDVGMGYYWIRKEDLQARRFEKVWMTWSCH